MAKKNKHRKNTKTRRAWATLKQYCVVKGDIASMQTDLWEMLKGALTKGDDYTDAANRSDFIYTYESVLEILDACFILHHHQAKKLSDK